MLKGNNNYAKRELKYTKYFENGDGLLLFQNAVPLMGYRLLLTDSDHYLLPIDGSAEPKKLREQNLDFFDTPVIDGIHIAVDEINEAGGIDGKIKIELLEKDVRSDAAQTSIATQELVDEGVSVIVLPCDADPALAAIGVVTEAQIPAISTCASSPTLPQIGGDYMFANFPGDNVQATVSAKWAYDEGHRSAYIIYSPDTQYTTMPLYFAEVFEKLGGKMLDIAARDGLGQHDAVGRCPHHRIEIGVRLAGVERVDADIETGASIEPAVRRKKGGGRLACLRLGLERDGILQVDQEHIGAARQRLLQLALAVAGNEEERAHAQPFFFMKA